MVLEFVMLFERFFGFSKRRMICRGKVGRRQRWRLTSGGEKALEDSVRQPKLGTFRGDLELCTANGGRSCVCPSDAAAPTWHFRHFEIPRSMIHPLWLLINQLSQCIITYASEIAALLIIPPTARGSNYIEWMVSFTAWQSRLIRSSSPRGHHLMNVLFPRV